MEDDPNVITAAAVIIAAAAVADAHVNCGKNPPIPSPVAGTNKAIVDAIYPYPRQAQFMTPLHCLHPLFCKLLIHLHQWVYLQQH